MARKQAAFTLIEMVAVLVLVGILAAVAGPRLIGQGDTNLITARDQLVSRLRLVQTMNMNEPSDQRTHLEVKRSDFAHRTLPANSEHDVSNMKENAGWQRIVSVGSNIRLKLPNNRTRLQFSLSFDRWGRPQAYNRRGKKRNWCEAGCEVILGDKQTQTINIEPEGYIHGAR